jgi:hypothetical protein
LTSFIWFSRSWWILSNSDLIQFSLISLQITLVNC